MRKEIIINSTANEIRIAITEDKRLSELYVETPEKERMVGDIYLGKVAKVMPGIRAAFIDVGLKQDGFLHFSDIGSTFSDYTSLVDDEDSDIDVDDDDEDVQATENRESSSFQSPPSLNESKSVAARVSQTASRGNGKAANIPDIKSGQDIIIQIMKEPVNRKGVRVTSEVSLPGRFLVLLPFDGKIGVSKKVFNFKEKRRLRRIVRNILPPSFGVIIRTVAQDKDEAALKQDLENLIATWREIEKSVKAESAPSLLYKDLSTTSSVIRDLFTEDVDRVITDSKKQYKEICAYVKSVSPQLLEKIELYKEREPLFDVYGIEKEIATALSRKVWLKSGGYIIIEQTEAMVVIDVNSGRYAAKREQELNSLRTNLEASREVCRQIRLRDVGGIIVIDFIDLDDEKNRKKVYDELRKEFRRDRAKVTVLPMTEIGIVQITRQRIRQNILHSFSEPCPVCGGGGLVQSKSSIVNQIERWIRRFKSESKEFRLILRAHPSIIAYLKEGTISRLKKMMFKYFVHIKIQGDDKLSIAEFHFSSIRQNKDITDQYKS
ncbi:MAG TPA: Rne/Rng family ribonuclease [Bacteroidota bacterium]|nr:Rne/Rng family ribonuclease [Bacteroidota bacterium]